MTKKPVNKIIKRGTKEKSSSTISGSQVINTLRNSPLKSSADGKHFYYDDTEYPEVIGVFLRWSACNKC